MMNNDKAVDGIVPGAWILIERLTRERFGWPYQCTRVQGSRVYYTVKNEGEPDREKYCALKSVLSVVPSEEAGRMAFKEQARLNAIYEREVSDALGRFRSGLDDFFKANAS